LPALIHIYRANFIRDFFYKVKGHMSNNYYTGKLELVAPHSYASCVVSIRKYDFTSTAVGSAGQDFETFYRDLEGGAGGGIGWYTAGFGPNVTDVTTI
jgi:outer membrane translocation and assembly module TamA